MKNIFLSTLILVIISFLSCACEKTNPKEQENVLSEMSVTGRAEDVTPLAATLVCYANLPANISAGTSFGVIYSEDVNPTFETAESIISDELNSNNSYCVSITGLQPATKYYFRSFVAQNGILKYGRVKCFTTVDAQIVTTMVPETVSAISASVPVELDLSGINPKEIRIGVCFSVKSENPEAYKDLFVEDAYSGQTSIELTSLATGTMYHYRAYAIVDGSLIYGDCLSFVTAQDYLATTNEPIKVGNISAEVSGNIDLSDCSFESVTYGICYSENENPTIESNVITIDKIESGLIKTTICGLEPDKVYFYRTFVIVDNTVHYGIVLHFRTLALYKGVDICGVSSVSAKIKMSCNIADSGYSNIELGVCYGEKENPTISDNIKSAIVNDAGVVEIDLLGLKQNTKYRVRPYTKIDKTLIYGEVKDFTTLGLVSDCSLFNVSGVSAKLSVTFDLSNAMYANGEFGVCYGESTNSAHVALGELQEGQTTLVITALQSNTKYYYRGYAKLDGIIYYGDIKHFTTSKFVESSRVSNISPISAMVNVEYDVADVVFDNAAYGVCMSVDSTPTIDDIKCPGNIQGNAINVDVKKLNPATSYYYRGYAVVDDVIHYGDIKKFATGECRFFTTGLASDVTYCSATLSANFNLSNSLYDSIEYGICYSDKAAPTIADYTVGMTPDVMGNAEACVANLICSTEYYYKPYVTVDGATYYGLQRVFETAWDPFVVAELEAGRLVDLGLSVHWASCNVGSLNPEDIGNRYAWGEISIKETFTWENYKFTEGKMYDGSPILSKYTEGDNCELSDDDDVACATLGGTYRMPRECEMQELIDKCSWVWSEMNSVKGFKITGPNGKSIFLPSKNFVSGGTELWHGYYWSKTRYSDSYGSTKWGVCILTSGVTVQPDNNGHQKYYHDRCDGLYVRPVSPY